MVTKSDVMVIGEIVGTRLLFRVFSSGDGLLFEALSGGSIMGMNGIVGGEVVDVVTTKDGGKSITAGLLPPTLPLLLPVVLG